MGGIMSLTGQPGGPPARVGSSVGDIVAGLFTAIGVNGALYRRTMTGEGVSSTSPCSIARWRSWRTRSRATSPPARCRGRWARATLRSPLPGLPRRRTGTWSSPPATTRCSRRSATRWRGPSSPRTRAFVDNPARNANIDALEQEFEAILAAHPTAHWLRVLEAAGVPCSPINRVDDVLADPQVAARTW